MAAVGLTRRALLGSAAAAGVVAATPWPLRALAQSGSGTDIAQEWADLAHSQVGTGDKDPSGAAYTVIQPGKDAIAEGVGTLSRHAGADPVASNTIFEIGSTTKVFTAILLGLTVVSDMGVTLDTTLERFLPGVTNKKVTKLSFRELAQYTNCLLSDPPGHNSPNYTVDELNAWLNGPDALLKPCHPDHSYYYSNIGWGLLGYALGQVWNTDWTDLVRNRLALALGMSDTLRTGTQDPEQQLRTATGYDKDGNEAPPQLGAPFLGGGGELSSTAADMARFIEVNIDPTRAGSLEPAIRFAQGSLRTYKRGVEEGTTPPPQKLDPRVSVGLGWFADMTKDGALGWSKNGGTQGFESFVGFIPSTGVGIFMVLNKAGFNPQGRGRELLGLGPLDADPG
jgi:CubicO group peptidase (beta-lactamase class C family)